nr:lob domain-containing protein 12 [Quercus suber]
MRSIDVTNSPVGSASIGSSSTWNACGSGNILCSKVDGSEIYSTFGPPKTSLDLITPTWFTSSTFLSKDDHRKIVASTNSIRCQWAKDCIFAPYFPSDDPHKFAIVHKIFGATNVSKISTLSDSRSEILAAAFLDLKPDLSNEQQSGSNKAHLKPHTATSPTPKHAKILWWFHQNGGKE